MGNSAAVNTVCVAVVTAALALSAGGIAVAAPVGAPPMMLPAGGASQAGVSDWIVGARRGPESAAIAARFNARWIPGLTAVTVARAEARGLARSLAAAGLLTWAEPNIRVERRSAYERQLGGWARGAVVPADLIWPTPGGVPVAVIDDRVDGSVEDLSQQTRWLNQTGVVDPHGTMVASTISSLVGSGPAVGVFPGTPILSYGLTSFTCADVATGIDAATAAGARVINMSFGTEDPCFTMYAAIQRAYAKNVLSVASAGNEFASGNPTEYPASFPHVLSVAATDKQGRVSKFSNANWAVDLAGPGVDVPVNVPLKFDTRDSAVDGITTATGTSFSAPIAAGAAAWVAAARPDLVAGQIADVLRRGAKDISPNGYDRHTGFGLINIPGALAQPTPLLDPREPNDAISLVNGTALGSASPYFWAGGPAASLKAKIDQIKDPLDIYRIKIPAGSAARVSVKPKFGGADLTIYSSRAKTASDWRYRIARSKKTGRLVDSVRVNNRSSNGIIVYAVVRNNASSLLNAEYTLRVGR